MLTADPLASTSNPIIHIPDTSSLALFVLAVALETRKVVWPEAAGKDERAVLREQCFDFSLRYEMPQLGTIILQGCMEDMSVPDKSSISVGSPIA